MNRHCPKAALKTPHSKRWRDLRKGPRMCGAFTTAFHDVRMACRSRISPGRLPGPFRSALTHETSQPLSFALWEEQLMYSSGSQSVVYELVNSITGF